MGRFFQSLEAFLEYLNFKGLNALHYALKRGSREMVEDIIDALSEPMRLSFICRTGNYLVFLKALHNMVSRISIYQFIISSDTKTPALQNGLWRKTEKHCGQIPKR